MNTLYKYEFTDRERKNPKTGPYNVGESIHKNNGPGIAKACRRIYK